MLAIEVASTSLAYDRAFKAGLYARHKFQEYWVVDAVRPADLSIRRAARQVVAAAGEEGAGRASDPSRATGLLDPPLRLLTLSGSFSESLPCPASPPNPARRRIVWSASPSRFAPPSARFSRAAMSSDPVLNRQVVTVAGVRMSPDLKLATVSVLPLGGQATRETIVALATNKKALRTLVAQRVSLKYAPDLRFVADESFDVQARMDALLRSPRVARDLGARTKTRRARRARPRRGQPATSPSDVAERRGPRSSAASSAPRSTAGSISTSPSASPRRRRSGGSSSCSTPRRRDTPARSTRSPRACCRSRSARRPRRSRSCRKA